MFEFSNREIAIAVWAVVIFAALLFIKGVPNAAFKVVKALFQPKLLGLMALVALYAAICVFILHYIGIWTWGNLKTTIIWLVTFALVTVFSADKLKGEAKEFKAVVVETISLTAIILYVGEFHNFPLWGELILVPTLTLLGLLIAVGQTKKETEIVVKALTPVQTAAALCIMGFSAYYVVTHLKEFASLDTLRDFGVPVLLTAMFLPFLYAFLLYSAYEQAAVRLRFIVDDPQLRKYALIRGMTSFGHNLPFFQRFLRNVGMAENVDRAKIKTALAELRLLKKREARPPVIFWEEGWSPYEARDFLECKGFTTDDYHRSYDDEWWAKSNFVKVGTSLFPADFSYTIYGTERVATRLKLSANIFVIEDSGQEAEANFVAIAEALIATAINPEAGSRFAQSYQPDADYFAEMDGVTVSVKSERWGIEGKGGYRKYLRLRHRADALPVEDGWNHQQ